jgi:hypothetical protein
MIAIKEDELLFKEKIPEKQLMILMAKVAIKVVLIKLISLLIKE